MMPSIFTDLPASFSCIEKITNSLYPSIKKVSPAMNTTNTSKKNHCYMYLRDKVKGAERKGFPATLISYLIERPTAETNIVSYSLATFNTKDTLAIYSRAFLREVAVGRLHLSPKTLSLDTKEYSTLAAIQHAIIQDMGSNKSLPTRVQKATKNWLKNTVPLSQKQVSRIDVLCMDNAEWENDLSKGKCYQAEFNPSKPDLYTIIKADSGYKLSGVSWKNFQIIPARVH